VSLSSKGVSSYTISTTTGMKKKKDKKKCILSRNVKEGSPLEEEYLVAFINDLQSKVDLNISMLSIM
jgi:elongator complex protein 1